MSYNKLGYVKATPALALPKVPVGNPDVKVWQAPAGPGNWQFSNTQITYNGITFGEIAAVPLGPGGEKLNAKLVLGCVGADKDNYYLFTTAAMYADMTFSDSRDVYIALVDMTVPEAGLSNKKCVLVCGALDTGGGDGDWADTLEGIQNLKGYGVTPTVNEVYALFPANQKPSGVKEDIYIGYDFDAQFEPSPGGDWLNFFEGGETGYEQIDKTYFSGSSAMLDLRIDDAAAIIAGAVLNIGEDPSMPLYSITGGGTYYGVNYGIPGDDLTSLKAKLLTILNAAMAPGQPLNGKVTFANPSGDNLPSWVQLHLEGLSTVWLSQNTIGYEALSIAPAESHFSGGSSPMLDLRIDDADAVKDGGILHIGNDAGGDAYTVVGGNNYYGTDYGVNPADTLSDLKNQLVTILTAASAPGQPLDGILTVVSPSSDNLPFWVQIHLESVDETAYVYSVSSGSGNPYDVDVYLDSEKQWKSIHGTSLGTGVFTSTYKPYTTSDELVNEPWEAEFNFDLTNNVPSGPLNPSTSPSAVFYPVALAAPGVDGAGGPGIAFMSSIDGVRKATVYGFDFSGDGPATGAHELTQETGRIKITHDGSQNYEWFVSYDIGPNYTWTSIFTSSGGDPGTFAPGYQTAEKYVYMKAKAEVVGDVLDMRVSEYQLLVERNIDVFNSLQDGQIASGAAGYLADMLGFTDGVNDYRCVIEGGVTTVDGHNAVDAGSFMVEEIFGNGKPSYRLDPLRPIFDGIEDAYGLACKADFGSGDRYFTFICKASGIPTVVSNIVGMGGTADPIGKVFTKNGVGEDYIWAWAPPVPPTPPSQRVVGVDPIDAEFMDDVLLDTNY